MSRWMLARGFFGALAAGLVVGLMVLILVPVVIGWRPYTVLTGSMRPVIQPGDVVMDRPQRASSVHVGQVVTFSDPSRRGRLVTHRVRSIAHGRDATVVETRGDANNTSEHWQVRSTDQVGVVVYKLPWIGHVSVLVRTPLGILVLVIIPVLGLGFVTLKAIWRDDEDEDTGPGDDADAVDAPGAAPDDDTSADEAGLGLA